MLPVSPVGLCEICVKKCEICMREGERRAQGTYQICREVQAVVIDRKLRICISQDFKFKGAAIVS